MAQAGNAPQPTPYTAVPATFGQRRFTVTLPAEIVLAAEDQAAAQSMTLAQWIQEYTVTGLQMQLWG